MAATSAGEILLRPLFLFFGFIIFGETRAELMSSGPLMVGTWPHKNEKKRHIKNPENERESVERVKYQLSAVSSARWLSHFLLSTFYFHCHHDGPSRHWRRWRRCCSHRD